VRCQRYWIRVRPYARPVPDLTLEPIDDLASVREDWTALAERAGNVFATWEWADAWWRVYGEGRPLRITSWRDASGRLVAVLPLYLSTRRPVRTLRFVGHGPADQLGPVCAPQDRSAVAEALKRLLTHGSGGWDLLLAERLAPAEGWSGALGGRVVHREESPTLLIAGRSFDEFLASRSKNFREQVRRRDRKLRREHEVELRLTDAERLDADLDALFRLHAARWSEGESSALTGSRERFHRDFAHRALERGWLRLWVLEADGAPRAAWYGFRFAEMDWYYQSGRDPEWERESVGFVLMSHTVRQAFDDGMTEYRLLRGGEEYKGRFASDEPGLETLALSRGLMGRGAIAAAAAARSMPPVLRRRALKLAG
jgi:CelD/BcsL family acetyltransferase involved in cellulose biosynthesis